MASFHFFAFCVGLARWRWPVALAGGAGRSGRRQAPPPRPLWALSCHTRHAGPTPARGPRRLRSPTPAARHAPVAPGPAPPRSPRRDGRRDGRHAQLARERHRPPAGRVAGNAAHRTRRPRARAARAVLLNLHIHDTKDYHGAPVKYTCACSAHLCTSRSPHARLTELISKSN